MATRFKFRLVLLICSSCSSKLTKTLRSVQGKQCMSNATLSPFPSELLLLSCSLPCLQFPFYQLSICWWYFSTISFTSDLHKMKICLSADGFCLTNESFVLQTVLYHDHGCHGYTCPIYTCNSRHSHGNVMECITQILHRYTDTKTLTKYVVDI